MSDTMSDRDAGFPPSVDGTTRARKRISLKKLASVGVAIAVIAGGAWYGQDWWTNGRFIESTDDSYVGGNVTTIAPHVSGFIGRILVADNQFVRAGQLMIELDPRDYQAAADNARAVVAGRQAALDELQARYELQQSTIRQEAAELSATSAQLSFATDDADRYRRLAATSAGSRQDAQRASSLAQQTTANLAAATAALEAGREQLKVLSAEITGAEANLAQAQAAMRQASLNLDYTQIRAPIDGYIGNRAAQQGSYVPAGAYLISVIPSSGLWVDANFKEDQLTHMVEGDAATITADVLPGHIFHAHVASVAPGTGAVFSVIPAENATGNFTKIVQRVPVRLVLDGNDSALAMLRPGLSTFAHVDIRRDKTKP
ncbi:HlyD family secretion protein [Acidisoma cellulosilytica]|uniref:HlyD family secretion protein n=1 Tax=Acidisoma cellulosilyticum TaxID=2802395 RepID=A0A963Z1N2_9PROT|nr:HlyD family secretion protein [Acidisoma cellulosilyticum]MCB8881173.1 HlyD family secretion protein [Acidisoma cellulosilyticum]